MMLKSVLLLMPSSLPASISSCESRVLQGTAKKEPARNANAGGQGSGNSQPVAAIRFAQLLYNGEESMGEIAPAGSNHPVNANFQQLLGPSGSNRQRQPDRQQHLVHEEQMGAKEGAIANPMDEDDGEFPQMDVSEGFEVWTPGQAQTADSGADVAASGSVERSFSHNSCGGDENDAGAAAGILPAPALIFVPLICWCVRVMMCILPAANLPACKSSARVVISKQDRHDLLWCLSFTHCSSTRDESFNL